MASDLPVAFREEYGWACACLDGLPYPFIHGNSVRTKRIDAQAYLGAAWKHEDETPAQGWRRAYRRGWRCIRVKISQTFEEPGNGK